MADEPGDEPPTQEPKYDQKFFLKLAREGKKDAWNAWRLDPVNKGVRVTFAGIDFSEAPWDEIDFSGFEFGDEADFSGCKWRGIEWKEIEKDQGAFAPGRACFARAVFGESAHFDGAGFGKDALFTGATFNARASFNRAAFGDFASFVGAALKFGADFTGVGFGREAHFTGAAFGHNAHFTRATFGPLTRFDGAAFASGADFTGASFGNEANFTGVGFGDRARFGGAAFGDEANFTGAAFSDEANFTGAAFSDEANFTGAAFGRGARFTSAAFGNGTSFEAAAFGDVASFEAAAFGDVASFDGTVFRGGVKFTGESKEESSRHLEARAEEAAENRKQALIALKKRHENSWKHHSSGPDRFLTSSFANARFDGEADFFGRNFEQATDFTNARFYSPPDFDAATNAYRIDFTGAYIGFGRPGRPKWTFQSRIPIRLRALRKIAEDTKNHDLERDLYIEERKAERGVYLVRRFLDWVKGPERKWALIAHLLWIAVMGVYWALADYGRSFVRPAAWLIASVFFFDWRYNAVLAPLMATARAPEVDKYKQALGMLALGNAVPFVGPLTIDSEIKKFLFCLHDTTCQPIPPEGYQLLVVGQNLVSIILVFFIGLALRNYFRIK